MGISKTPGTGILIPNRSRLAEFGAKKLIIFFAKKVASFGRVHSKRPVKNVHRHRIKITQHTIEI